MKYLLNLIIVFLLSSLCSYAQGILTPLQLGMYKDDVSAYIQDLVDEGQAELMYYNNPKLGCKIVDSEFSAGKYELYLYIQPIYKKKELVDVVIWANRKGMNMSSGKSLNKAYHDEIIEEAQIKAAEYGILLPFEVRSQRSGYQKIHFIVAHLEPNL